LKVAGATQLTHFFVARSKSGVGAEHCKQAFPSKNGLSDGH